MALVKRNILKVVPVRIITIMSGARTDAFEFDVFKPQTFMCSCIGCCSCPIAVVFIDLKRQVTEQNIVMLDGEAIEGA